MKFFGANRKNSENRERKFFHWKRELFEPKHVSGVLKDIFQQDWSAKNLMVVAGRLVFFPLRKSRFEVPTKQTKRLEEKMRSSLSMAKIAVRFLR